MPPVRRFRPVSILCGLLLLTVACDDPPLKELHQAEGAVEAARAAGADQYASEEYEAALEALGRYDEAVQERDYRLALNHALDAREWAQEAARQAADRRARVRSEAEQALGDLATVRDELTRRLSAAQTSRLETSALSAARAALEEAEGAVQEARSALDREDYLKARSAVAGVTERLREAERALAAAAGRQPAGSR